VKLSRKGLGLRLVFLLVLVGGLVTWLQLRKPRACQIELDLTSVLPGEVTGLDLVVRRDGSGLLRFDTRYGPQGAPGLVKLEVQARPGAASLEATLIYGAGKEARRTRAEIVLAEERPARVRAE